MPTGSDGVKGYTLKTIHVQRARQFRTSVHDYSLTFDENWLTEQDTSQLSEVLSDQFDLVLQELQQEVNGSPQDRVGICIKHPALDSPIRIPFRRQENLHGEDILAAVEKVQKSNGDLNIDNQMEVTFLHVENPERLGHGLGRLYHVTGLTDFLERKGCIVQIKNTDNLCFARALVVAEHYANKPKPVTKEWNVKRKAYTRTDRRDVLGEQVQCLYHEMQIPPGPCTGFDTWIQFAPYFAEKKIQFKIYSQDVFRKLIYKNEVVQPKKTLHLFHHHDHYDVITSMAAFTGNSYFCDICDQGFNSLKTHPCTKEYTCIYCKHDLPCPPMENHGKSCLQCHRWFLNPTCFKHHKENGTCQRIQKCQQCQEEINVQQKPMEDHECRQERSCKICGEPLVPDHRCYVSPPKEKDPEKEEPPPLYVFYDFECMQETGVHKPNLCVVHLGCVDCIDHASQDLCENCPWRTCEGEGPSRVKVFKGPTTLEDMGSWVLSLNTKSEAQPKQKPGGQKRKHVENDVDDDDDNNDDGEVETSNHRSILFIAHNYRSYDGHLLMQFFHKNIMKAPELTLRGQQILKMKIGRLIFKDSLNFITMSLKKFPATFGLDELKKGYFPHLFNTEDNQQYVGPLPPVESFDPKNMSSKDYKTFLVWHKAQMDEGKVYNLAEEILTYCQSDVDILRRGCAAFRRLFMDECDVDPFEETVTLPMACMTAFRKTFLIPKTIAIIPPQGYRPRYCYSKIALHWLCWLMYENPQLRIQHARNGGEKNFLCANGSTYSVDGWDPSTGTAMEFLGCIWHGCPKCYTRQRWRHHDVFGSTFAECFKETQYRLSLLSQHPEVQHLKVLWECEFQQEIQQNAAMKTFLTNLEDYLTELLNPRDAFYGGRTNATKLFYEAKGEESIHYVDVCSLYPYICKYGRFPTGHPLINDHPPVESLPDLHGLIQCKVLPPKQLYHPLLPLRAKGKLLFPLCRTCAEQEADTNCVHSDEERAWVGTYTTLEVQMAVKECGYRVLVIYEAWHFPTFSQYDPETKEGGIFTDYINNFFKIKQEASGYPKKCQDKEAYVRSIFEKEGVQLDPSQIKRNEGLRMLGKMTLNAFWGKFGQREGFGKSKYIADPYSFFALILDERNIIKDIMVINDHLLFVNYEPQKNFHEPHPASNVVIAAWVTTQARLKLYEYLKPLDRRVLYFDTDSVIYVHHPQLWNPPLGDTLGDLTDELSEGNTIETFVSAGPKNYAYKLAKPELDGTQTVCKIRGFTLNYRASQMLNFETMKGLICGKVRDHQIITVEYPHKIIRGGLKQGNTLLSKDMKKKYRLVYTKRRLILNEDMIPVDTLPFGYME